MDEKEYWEKRNALIAEFDRKKEDLKKEYHGGHESNAFVSKYRKLEAEFNQQIKSLK